MLKRFDQGPLDVAALNVFTRDEQQVSVTRDAFVDSLRVLLYVPSAMSLMPLLIHQAATGISPLWWQLDFELAIRSAARSTASMQFSVICAEDNPFHYRGRDQAR